MDVDAWADAFPYQDGYVEGATAHFLACDKIIVLRCRPDVLKDRLSRRGYSAGKVAENCQAEALDVILSETADMFASEHVYEIDTTNRDVISVAVLIVSFAADETPASFGRIVRLECRDPLV